MDKVTPEERSRIMRLVRGKDTKPELAVRQLVRQLGYRVRLNDKTLPGCPDLVLSGRKKAIFVHGCFWHQHSCRRGSRTPASRREYWEAKLARNKARDAAIRRQLRRAGWGVMVVWECQLRDPERVARRLKRFLDA